MYAQRCRNLNRGKLLKYNKSFDGNIAFVYQIAFW